METMDRVTRLRIKAAALAFGAALLLGAPPPLAAQALSPEQRKEVVDILREALRSDPSILRDAIEALQQAAQDDRAGAQRAAIAAREDALLRDPADPVKGNPRGDVTIVEFFDARCGYCKTLHPAMEALLREDPQLRLVLKDLPILGPNSVLASRALLAAQRQGKYLPLQDALMRLKGEPTEAALQAEAQRVGLDWARLKRDMQDPELQARLQGHLELAHAIGIEGTPALVIGGKLVPGAVDLPSLRQLVAEARQQGKRPG